MKKAANILVVGGHSRSVGKTLLIVEVIRAFPSTAWIAIKITQFGHGVCSVNGASCGCAVDEHTVALDEEKDRSGETDTSRFLLAGAARAFWLRTKQGRLAEALPMLREVLAAGGSFVLESNAVLQFLRPALYLAVLDPLEADFKASCRLALDRADAFILRNPLTDATWSADVPLPLVARKPQFLCPLGREWPTALRPFLAERLFAVG
jgi:hypothetical protein